MPFSRTQHGLTRVGLEPPTSGSGVRGMNADEESEFKQLVNDAIQNEHTEERILNNTNNPGTMLSDKINQYYTTFNFLQKFKKVR